MSRRAIAFLVGLLACSREVLHAQDPTGTKSASLSYRTSENGLCTDAVLIIDLESGPPHEKVIGRCHDEQGDVAGLYQNLQWKGDSLVLTTIEGRENLPDSFDVGPVHVSVDRRQ